MLWIKNKGPKLNTQTDSIRAKLFTWMLSCQFIFSLYKSINMPFCYFNLFIWQWWHEVLETSCYFTIVNFSCLNTSVNMDTNRYKIRTTFSSDVRNQMQGSCYPIYTRIYAVCCYSLGFQKALTAPFKNKNTRIDNKLNTYIDLERLCSSHCGCRWHWCLVISPICIVAGVISCNKNIWSIF